jgi:hypothetical protein
VAATPPFAALARSHVLRGWAQVPEYTPVIAALTVIAVLGNASAIRRLLKLGAG